MEHEEWLTKIAESLATIAESSSNDLWSVLAIGISAITAGALAYNAFRQRRHDKLSVKPKLKFASIAPGGVTDAQIVLENHGLGPAIISAVRLFINDEEIPQKGFSWIKTLEEKVTNRLDAIVAVPPPDEPLRAGERLLLIQFEKSACNMPEPESPYVGTEPGPRLFVGWANIRIEIEYSSIYGVSDRCAWRGDQDLDVDTVEVMRTAIGKFDTELRRHQEVSERGKG